MAKRTLSPADGGNSGKVTLPKGDLALDGVLDDDGNVVSCPVNVQRTAPGEYKVVILDDELQPIDRTSTTADQEAAD